jgi:hypothetical protein
MNVESPMFARRRQTKKLLQVAKLLRELEAAKAPKARSRRARVSFSRV